MSLELHYWSEHNLNLNPNPNPNLIHNCSDYWTRSSTWGTTSWSTCLLTCSGTWPSCLSWLSVGIAWRHWMETCSPICLVWRSQTGHILLSLVLLVRIGSWIHFCCSPELKKLYLHDNPWQCDCTINSLVQWMGQTKATLSPQSSLKCASPPELQSKSLSSLLADKPPCPA